MASLLIKLLNSRLILCLALTTTLLMCSENHKTEFIQTPTSVQEVINRWQR